MTTTEPVFVDLLRRPGIDSRPGGPVRNSICRTGEIDSSVSIPGLHKRLQIRAQDILVLVHTIKEKPPTSVERDQGEGWSSYRKTP